MPRLLHHISARYRTPEVLAYFDRYFLRFYSANPAVLRSKGVDVLGLRFYSFTSREKY